MAQAARGARPDPGPRIAWEIIFADSSPTKGFDHDTMTLFDVIVKWLDHPEWMLKQSLSEQKQ